ncbi:DUF4236 domain-containing protein [Dermacoccus sp. 147Ba]|nr:DUF4236 domain-containing protein [Dermacoccus sp. 147Ba]
MGLRNTGRTTLGPLTVNYGATGRPSSVSVGLGPVRFRVWSHKGTTGVSSVDLPGPWSYRPNSTKSRR